MASKRHTGLGRGLDALFPIQDESAEAAKEIMSEATDSDNINEPHHDAEKTHHDADELHQPNQSHQDQIVMARLSRIEPNRGQPRKKFDEQALDELAQSISQHGLLQPILVQDRGTYYEIIAGERRWRAARKAGLREVPVIVRNYSDKEITELSLIENLQREDLNPIEEAKAYRILLIRYEMTQDELAKRLSKSRTAITNSLRLLNLDPYMQNMVIDGKLSMGQARALLRVDDPKKQHEMADRVADEGISVREVEKMVKRFKINQRSDQSTSRTSKKQKNDAQKEKENLFYRNIENQLRETLHTKVSVYPESSPNIKGAGKLEIEFYSSDDLEQIVNRLAGHEI